MRNTSPTTPVPVAVEDSQQPETPGAGLQPLAGERRPLWLPTWLWVAILAGMDVLTTIVGLTIGRHEANPAATIVGGVSIFLAIKVTLTAAMCWRWRRLGEKHWSTLSRFVVLGVLAGVVAWNIFVIVKN